MGLVGVLMLVIGEEGGLMRCIMCFMQMDRMGTLLEGTHPGAWRSSPLTSVRQMPINFLYTKADYLIFSEMLTPIDQPLDKLEDLDKMEMCVTKLPEQIEFLLILFLLGLLSTVRI